MVDITITTDGIERDFTYGHELDPEEWEEFEDGEDYPDEDDRIGEHFIRQGEGLYLESWFAEVSDKDEARRGWDMYYLLSARTGILLRYVDGGNGVVIGTYEMIDKEKKTNGRE